VENNWKLVNAKSHRKRIVAGASSGDPQPSKLPIQLCTDNRTELERLSSAEQTELRRCETVIAQGWQTFFDVGKALTTIRDHRLYRGEYKTFEAYCRQKWQYGRAYAYRLISAAEVVANLSTIGDKRMPENESQVRPLIGLTPEQIRKAWAEALTDSKGERVTARLVKQKASNYQERPGATKPIRRRTRVLVGATEMRDLLNTVIQLEQAVRRGGISETIFALLARLKGSVEELTNVFEIQRSKQER